MISTCILEINYPVINRFDCNYVCPFLITQLTRIELSKVENKHHKSSLTTLTSGIPEPQAYGANTLTSMTASVAKIMAHTTNIRYLMM